MIKELRKRLKKMKTKTVRVKVADAEKLEQAARVIGVALRREVTPSEVAHYLIESCLDEIIAKMSENGSQ